jgi:DNA-binding MarR family transcriptional regulator
MLGGGTLRVEMTTVDSHPDVGAASSLLIVQLARGARRRIEQAVAPTGLRLNEVLTLVHLRERGPSAQQTLVELMCVDATNLVAVLNSLEDAGLIERRRDRSDRRRAIVALAAPGGRLLAEVDRAFRQIDTEILAGLTQTERETLTTLLSDVVGHMAPGSQQSPDETR